MKHLKKGIAVFLALLMMSAWAALFVTAADIGLNDLDTVLVGANDQGGNGNDDPANPSGNGKDDPADPPGNGNDDPADPSGNGNDDPADPSGNGNDDPADPSGNGNDDPADPSGNGNDDPVDPSGNGNDDPADPSGNGNDDPADPSGNGNGTQEPSEPPHEEEPPKPQPTVTVKAEEMSVTVLKKIQLTAETSGFAKAPALSWSSSDDGIAKVDQSGKVTGVKAGRVTITATATLDGVSASGQIVLYVTRMRMPWRLLMRDTPVLSYQYSFIDDYYYIHDVDCWQRSFGFGRFYDLVAPYMLLEYDYVRVFFTYQDKDYMIQLWKGQYGLIFYGCEQGIYSKDHTDEEDGIFTFYKAMDPGEWPQMSLTLYHDKNRNGNYVREFTRANDTHWWCSGFKAGHLKKEEPANELRQEGTITFKDPEVARFFSEGLIVCGFKEAKDANSIGLDEFYHDGATVSFRWQDINRAETTMPIKIAGATAGVVGGLAAIIGIFLLILLIGGLIGTGALFLIILI